MKPNDRKLVLTVLRFVPHIVFAVIVQALGCVLLSFVLSILFPEHPWVWSSLTLPYLCWSTWRSWKYINRLSKKSRP